MGPNWDSRLRQLPFNGFFNHYLIVILQQIHVVPRGQQPFRSIAAKRVLRRCREQQQLIIYVGPGVLKRYHPIRIDVLPESLPRPIFSAVNELNAFHENNRERQSWTRRKWNNQPDPHCTRTYIEFIALSRHAARDRNIFRHKNETIWILDIPMFSKTFYNKNNSKTGNTEYE